MVAALPSMALAATMWHTQFYPTDAPLPHAFTVHLSSASVLGGFKYLPRSDGPPHGRIATWRLHTSVDGSNWSQVAQGSFVNDAAEKTVYLSLPTTNLPPPSASPTPVVNYEYDTEGSLTRSAARSVGCCARSWACRWLVWPASPVCGSIGSLGRESGGC